MGFKFGKENIPAWWIVGILQLIALMLLVPVAGSIHQKYFSSVFGNDGAWVLAIAYGIVEVLAFAALPMMHTAYKSYHIRFIFPVTLVCFIVAVSYDVYINNDVFKKRQAEHAQIVIDNRVSKQITVSESVKKLGGSLEKRKKSYDERVELRNAEHRRNILTIVFYDSLSMEYGKAKQSFYSKRYADIANSIRSGENTADSKLQKESDSISELESKYNAEVDKEKTAARADGEKVASAKAADGWFNDIFERYPGVIFLVLAMIISGIGGFVVDKYQLIVYEDTRKNLSRQRYFGLFFQSLMARLAGRKDLDAKIKAEAINSLRFSDNLTIAISELYELEKAGDDRKLKSFGIHPRQILADQFKITEQAIYNRLDKHKRDMFEELDRRPKNGKVVV